MKGRAPPSLAAILRAAGAYDLRVINAKTIIDAAANSGEVGAGLQSWTRRIVQAIKEEEGKDTGVDGDYAQKWKLILLAPGLYVCVKSKGNTTLFENMHLKEKHLFQFQRNRN